MYAIIAFIVGGAIGAVLMGAIASGKIADLYREIEYWKKLYNERTESHRLLYDKYSQLVRKKK